MSVKQRRKCSPFSLIQNYFPFIFSRVDNWHWVLKIKLCIQFGKEFIFFLGISMQFYMLLKSIYPYFLNWLHVSWHLN